MEESKETKKDFFYGTLEEEELVMEPHCSCGNYLLEEYFCEKCQRQCLCTEIRCKDKATLDYVNRFIKNNESFRNFKVVFDGEKEERND